MEYDLLLTPATGHVDGDVYYAQAIKESNGYVWNGTTAVETPASYALTVIDLDEIADMGIWAFSAPADLPVGIYSVICRKQAGEAPVATDNTVGAPRRIQKFATGRVTVL
jgi:hypothetical protein